jgi:hypothetical protein
MVPHTELASTQYCIANPGSEYLVYLPSSSIRNRDRILQSVGVSNKISVDLSEAQETFRVEWFNPGTGETVDGGAIKGGRILSFKVPFKREALLYLFRK